jgi:hypothetical protein
MHLRTGAPQVKLDPLLHPRLKARAAQEEVFLQDLVNDTLWNLVGGKPAEPCGASKPRKVKEGAK